MAKRVGVSKKPRKGDLIVATMPSKLLKAVVAQAEAEQMTFSDWVIQTFEEATVGIVEVSK